MARFKGQDLYLNDDDQVYFGDNQESALWYASGLLRLNTVISGVDPTAAYHLTTRWYVDTAVSGVDHSALQNLDYGSAGHTGFVSIGTVQTVTGTKTFDTIYAETIGNESSDDLFITTSNAKNINLYSANNILTSLGDNAGVNYFQIEDDIDSVLFRLGSDGQTLIAGDTTISGGLSLLAGVPIKYLLDEDDFASDSDEALATQQSIKAYIGDYVSTAVSGITVSGIDEFIELVDTPTAYSGAKGKFVRVNEAADALYFSEAIVGVTSTGTAPPDPGDTNLWYNNIYNDFFEYDPQRGKWLSVMIHNYLFTFQGNCDGLYLSIGDLRHAYAHYLLPRDATITAIIAIAEPTGNPDKWFDVKDDAVTIGNFQMNNWEYWTMDADIDFEAGGKLQCFCTSSGALVRNPAVTFEIRWRYEAP